MVFQWLIEFCLLWVYLFSTITGYLFPLTGINPHPTKKTKIVLVHGWMANNPIFYFLKRYLEKCGYQVYMTNPGLLLEDIAISAQKLKQFIDSHDLEDIVLVGESTGGLVAFEYAQHADGWKNVKKLICIGSPFKGSPFAIFGFFSKSARQMMIGSDYVKRLAQENITYPERMYCIATNHDEVILPGCSCLPQATVVQTHDIGHVRLQAFSKAVYHHIVNIAGD